MLDKIVELCISLGVTEFDLLHVIPQAAAFDHRDELFYDVRDHLPVLQNVLRLNRHPRFVVWTNRFPVSYLEGLEDLIQDPHKMLDEVNGRRFQVRRYLDEGKALDCRHAERCPHCFIEPFCTTMDRTMAAQHAASFVVYWVGAPPAEPLAELPFGATRLGVEVERFAALAAVERGAATGVYAVVASAEPIPEDLGDAILVARRAEQLDAWLGRPLPRGVDVDIELNLATGDWLLEHRELAAKLLDRIRVHQPSHEHMQEARDQDVREPRAFFKVLDLPIRVSGLPACLTPKAEWIEERAILEKDLFDAESGRLDIRSLARYHVRSHYRAKSVRCADCRVNDRCEGAHINMVRDQGLAQLTPLESGEEAERVAARLERIFPTPPARLATARPPEAASPSLPGFAPPGEAPPDPLAVIQREREAKRLARRRPLPLVKD